MKLLLTSGGVTNPSIERALVDLLGKPIAESSALVVPSAEYGHPSCTPQTAWNFVSGDWSAMAGLGWGSLGLLELLALPDIGPERWVPWVREVDALLVDGGEATYLAHQLRRSGLADLLPELEDKVWVGVSAGSMALTPRIGDAFVRWRPEGGSDRTLGVVDFSIFPHLDYPGWDENTSAKAREWAADLGAPAYALDDQSAVVVDGDRVEVVSEGSWLPLGLS